MQPGWMPGKLARTKLIAFDYRQGRNLSAILLEVNRKKKNLINFLAQQTLFSNLKLKLTLLKLGVNQCPGRSNSLRLNAPNLQPAVVFRAVRFGHGSPLPLLSSG